MHVLGLKNSRNFYLHAIREEDKYRKYSEALEKEENGSEYEASEESVSRHIGTGTESDAAL